MAELFTATTREVQRRFEADKRLPTEHAQLDDDGDGRGTEQVFPALEPPAEDAAPAKPRATDGAEARRTKIPYPPPSKPESSP